MSYEFTLPDLQTSLDRLGVAQTLTLASKQVDRLFGMNDVGTARLKRFARGHNCIVAHADHCVVFHKVWHPEGQA